MTQDYHITIPGVTQGHMQGHSLSLSETKPVKFFFVRIKNHLEVIGYYLILNHGAKTGISKTWFKVFRSRLDFLRLGMNFLSLNVKTETKII